VIAYPIFLDKNNANEIIDNYDIVLDASDNVNARYLVNDAIIAN
jgi:molybdopterin/thiamine biosynthesis adenylyltransferase